MAKNKGNQSQSRSDFDKFGNKPSSDATASVAEHPSIGDDDKDDDVVDDPIDTIPPDEPPLVTGPLAEQNDPTLGRGPVPVGAYKKLNQEAMKAQTIAEQEEILARMHPKHNTMRDPGEDYKRCLVSGRSVDPLVPRADADPLTVRSFHLIERLVAGGLIAPSAYGVYNQAVDLLVELKANLAEKPNAESGSGSAGGNSAVVS